MPFGALILGLWNQAAKYVGQGEDTESPDDAIVQLAAIRRTGLA